MNELFKESMAYCSFGRAALSNRPRADRKGFTKGIDLYSKKRRCKSLAEALSRFGCEPLRVRIEYYGMMEELEA
jgi:hypothetical protein